MIYYHIKHRPTEKVLMTNMSVCPEEFRNAGPVQFSDKKSETRGAYEDRGDLSVWLIAVHDHDLYSSTKLFRKLFEIYSAAAESVWDNFGLLVAGYSHTLNTLYGQMKQKIDLEIGESLFHAENHADSVSRVSSVIDKGDREIANLIIYLRKRVLDLGNHIASNEIIQLGANYAPAYVNVSLRRAMLNQASPFQDDIEGKRVSLSFNFGDEILVTVDKNLFGIVMHNFFSNARKFARPNSEIRFSFDGIGRWLDVSMISRRIEKNEMCEIMKDGIRGMHSRGTPGCGIGLYMIQSALKKMGKEPMYIDPRYDRDSEYDGVKFCENHFRILFGALMVV